MILKAWIGQEMATFHRSKRAFSRSNRCTNDCQPDSLADGSTAAQILHPTLQEFKTFIETNPTILQLFHSMFREVPSTSPYDYDPSGQPQIRDYLTMLRVFNVLMAKGPYWIYNAEGQKALIGFPFNAALAYPMATAAGIALFSRPDINQYIRKILNSWADFLASPASISVLTTKSKGWFSNEALDVMAFAVNEAIPTSPRSFAQAYICDPTAEAYGYKSWDDFFTRRWREGVRPIASPHDASVICNACESSPYLISHNVKLNDKFSLKEQPYSLLHMLDNDPLAVQFSGGTVYQAFLSALSYHRWHAPVTGTIAKVVHIPGTYYLQNASEGFANIDPVTGVPNPDLAAPNKSQAYLCQKATRTLIFIRADDARIGLVAVLLVGMAEVSSCEAFVKAGQRVKKGDEIGTFHYGGSTHCLIFRPEVKLHFLPTQPFGTANVAVCSAVALLESGVERRQ
jgi:phosphatidylserine decarboxylase